MDGSGSVGVSDLEGGGTSESYNFTQSSFQTPLVSNARSYLPSDGETEKSRSYEPDKGVLGYSESESNSAEVSNTCTSKRDALSSTGVFMTQEKEFPDCEKTKLKFESDPEILQACMNGDVPVVKNLIAQYCDLTETDSNKRTALHVASSFGRVGVVRLLLLSGADIDACSVSGQSPLHEACSNGRFDVLRVLASEVADLDKVDFNGLSAAHCCALNGETKCLSLLCNQVTFF